MTQWKTDSKWSPFLLIHVDACTAGEGGRMGSKRTKGWQLVRSRWLVL